MNARLIAAAALWAVATACHAQAVKIGELNSYKVFPAFLEPYKKGMELAVEEINAAGGRVELVVRDGRHYPLATEGGHAGFAPGTPEEIAVLERLSACYGRVSNERVVSGGGLVNLHRALSEIAGLDPGPLQPEDITARAAEGDRRCLHAIDVFCAVFGAIAGDLVLTLGAWDGVFLSGGMVPLLLPALQHSGFRERFEGKGRYAPAMSRVPTLAVLHPQPGLLGAAALAAEAACGERLDDLA